MRELIEFSVNIDKSEKTWRGVLNDLYRRRLAGEALGLVLADGNSGLENAWLSSGDREETEVLDAQVNECGS